MAKRSFNPPSRKKKGRGDRRDAPTSNSEMTPYVPKPRVTYGEPFIVMEDSDKNTFSYNGMAWVPFSMTIKECRAEGQVKELPQKLNGKTRYQVRIPVGG